MTATINVLQLLRSIQIEDSFKDCSLYYLGNFTSNDYTNDLILPQIISSELDFKIKPDFMTMTPDNEIFLTHPLLSFHE